MSISASFPVSGETLSLWGRLPAACSLFDVRLTRCVGLAQAFNFRYDRCETLLMKESVVRDFVLFDLEALIFRTQLIDHMQGNTDDEQRTNYL